jgi:hypothetical protein
MLMPEKIRNLPHTSPKAGQKAREQADAYDSMFADIELELDDGATLSIPPHPDLGMLDDEATEQYEELQFEMESYDREEDIFIPEQRLMDPDGNETGVVLPGSTAQGQLKRPYRKDGELVKPPHSIRVARIALGEEGYQRLVAGGRSAGDVWRAWAKQAAELRDREEADSKSEGSSVDLEAVPSGNRK